MEIRQIDKWKSFCYVKLSFVESLGVFCGEW